MDRRVLIAVHKDEVAPRFDLASEALLLTIGEHGEVAERKSFLLAHASGDELCDLVLSRDISTVVCGAIEEEYYHYLRWRRVDVIDSVVATVEDATMRLAQGRLRAGDMLLPRAV